ncbi:MAG TPA: hypothetical protein V6D20_07790 [Candidatus Obscuribacterales bacterium]
MNTKDPLWLVDYVEIDPLIKTYNSDKTARMLFDMTAKRERFRKRISLKSIRDSLFQTYRCNANVNEVKQWFKKLQDCDCGVWNDKEEAFEIKYPLHEVCQLVVELTL